MDKDNQAMSAPAMQIVQSEVKKCKHVPIIIFLIIFAIGGLGFGGYELWQNMQKENQISDLREQLNNQQDDKTEQLDGDSIANYKNPVIESSNSNETYRLWFETSRYFTGEDSNFKTMQIGIENGAIYTCKIYVHSLSDDQTNGGRQESDCNITGVVGEIYDIIEFGEGQDNENSNIGFIMVDGSVEYFPFIESMKNNSFDASKKLHIDGYVVDAKQITVGSTDSSAVGGYGSTAFILDNGKFVKYEDSMLEKW